MLKKGLCLLLFFAGLLMALPTTYLLEMENFSDATFPPDNWEVIDGGPPETWFGYLSQVARINTVGGEYQADWLITPLYNGPVGADSVVLQFWHQLSHVGGNQGSCLVAISVDGGFEFVETVAVYPAGFGLDMGTVRLRIDNLATPLSGLNKAGFYYHILNGDFWHIDSVWVGYYAHEPSPPTFNCAHHYHPVYPSTYPAYPETVLIWDISGISIASVELCYDADTGTGFSGFYTCQTITADSIGGDGTGKYIWDIPYHPAWSTIRYYFKASDLYAVSPSVGISSTFELVVGENYYAYDWTDVAYSEAPDNVYRDISIVGTDLGLSYDDDYTYIDLPFVFRYYGLDYTRIYVSTNGWITVGNLDPGTSGFGNDPIPDTWDPNNTIAPLWDDLVMSSGAIYYYTAGDTFIVEWNNARRFGSSTYFDFEVMFVDPSACDELGGNGEIIIKYNSVPGSELAGCSVGIENMDGTIGLEYLYNDVYGTDARIVDGATPISATPAAVKFTTNPPPSGTIQGFVTLTGETDHSGVTIGGIGGATHPTTITDATGYYEFVVPEGTYDVYAYKDFSWSSETVYTVVVTADTVIVMDFTLDPMPISMLYYSDFEVDDGGLVPDPATGGWEWGIPTVGPAAAHSGNNCWATILDGDYTINADYKLDLQLNFIGLESAVLTFWHWYEIEGFYGTAWDGGNIKVSTNGGIAWDIVYPNGGYPATNIQAAAVFGEDGFGGHGTIWTADTFDLSAYLGFTDVRIRWHFGADNSVFYEGWYIDDVAVQGTYTEFAVITGIVMLNGETDHSGTRVEINGPVNMFDITDAAGAYHMIIPPGTYNMDITHEPLFYPEIANFTVADGDTLVQNFLLEKRPFGWIAGYVDLLDTPGADAGVTLDLLGTALTELSDVDGYYLFDNVLAGTFAVVGSEPGYSSRTSTLFEVVIGETTYVDTIFLPVNPYTWDFEADSGDFEPDPLTGGWEWGIPTDVFGPPNTHSGTQCWGTDLDADYPSDADWTLMLDVSDVSDNLSTMFFWHWHDIESHYDGGNISVSTDNGVSWAIVDPEGGYDDPSISTAFGNPIGGQPAFTAASGDWIQEEVDLTEYTGSITHVRFRLGTDSSVDYPGWFIDDVLLDVGSVFGCVRGYVYEESTFEPIPDATVRIGSASTTTNFEGAFVLCDVPFGYWEIMAATMNYAPGFDSVIVAQNDTAGPVYIPLEPLVVEPITSGEGFIGDISFEEPDSEYITICNPSDEPFTITIVGIPGDDDGGKDFEASSIIGRKLRNPTDEELVAHRNKMIELNLDELAPTCGRIRAEETFVPKAFGDVVDSINIAGPEMIGIPWGFGTVGLSHVRKYWVSTWSEPYKNVELTSAGVFSGTHWPVDWVSAWPADMAYDGQFMWQVKVGEDNALYQWDPNTGVIENIISDPDFWWDWFSQRGVGYDPARDIFYVGGWNEDIIYQIKGLSWPNPGDRIQEWFSPVSGIAGIAFSNSRRTVWLAINGERNYIFEFDPVTETMTNLIELDFLGDYELSGLEFDADGLLWVVTQTAERAYAIDIDNGDFPVGVAFEPHTIVIPANSCTTFAIFTNGVAVPGVYEFDLAILVGEDTIYHCPVTISVSKEVQQGWSFFSVPFETDPNSAYMQLSDDIAPFYNEPTNSNVLAWDPDRGQFAVPDTFERGRGYYVKAWWDHTMLDFVGIPYYNDFTINLPYYDAPVNPGWNLAGNPVNTIIDWDNIVNDPMFAGLLPIYYNDEGGSYSPGFPTGADRYIDPLEGFFVVLQTGVDGVLPVRDDGIHPVFAKALTTKVVETTMPNFTTRIGVNADGDTDMWNYLATLSEASDGIDTIDGPEPPFGDHFLSFICEEEKLMRDVKAPIDDGDYKYWTVEVAGVSPGSLVEVFWPMDHIPDGIDAAQGMNQIYTGYDFELWDGATVVDMRTTDHYNFTYHGSHVLYVLVYATYLEADNVAQVPTRLELMHNVPNPFNAATEISFTLPVDEDISLEIIDLNGRVVRNLAYGSYEAGRHSVIWDGKNSNSAECATGIYFYRLRTENNTLTRKMILIK